MYNVSVSKGEKIRLVAVGSSCSLSIQDITVNSPTPTELKYYSASTSAWVDTHVTIPMTVSPSDTAISFYTLDASVISPSVLPQQYLILTHNGEGDLIDAMTLRVGSPDKTQLDRIGLAVAPARRELSRITDTIVRISSFSDVAGTSEKMRIQVEQDTSGNQPEEIQTDVSGTIA